MTRFCLFVCWLVSRSVGRFFFHAPIRALVNLLVIGHCVSNAIRTNDAYKYNSYIQKTMIRLEEEIPRLATRHRMFQQLRGYFTDLVDCYDEKVRRIFVQVLI